MVHHNDTDRAATSQAQAKPAEPTELPPTAPVLPAPTLALAPRQGAPTHLRPFRHRQDCSLVTRAAAYLGSSGFYWGPLDVEEAHGRLAGLPVGTFLIRDSMQSDVFFTLSYRAAEGPTSVRVLLKNGSFSLDGSKHTFPCLFALLEFYISSPKRSLRRPYRGNSPQTLQELARRAVVQAHGRDSLDQLPVSTVLRNFLQSYPFSI